MSRVRVGILGCGDVAIRRYLPYLQTLHSAEVAAVYDVRPERQRLAIELAGTAVAARDVADLIGGYGLDLVAILTPAGTHRDLVRRCLNAGVNVYCEKPLAWSAADATELYAMAAAKGASLIAAPGLDETPGVLAIRRLMHDGTIGQPVQVHFSCGELGPARSPWFTGDPKPYYAWDSRGCLYDLGIYAVHLAVALFGVGGQVQACARRSRTHVKSVTTSQLVPVEAPDVWSLLLQWPRSGPIATAAISWADHGREPPTATIVGTEGSVRAPIFWLHTEGNLELWNQKQNGALLYQRLGESDLSLPPKIGLGLGQFVGGLSEGRRCSNAEEVCETLRILNEAWKCGARGTDTASASVS